VRLLRRLEAHAVGGEALAGGLDAAGSATAAVGSIEFAKSLAGHVGLWLRRLRPRKEIGSQDDDLVAAHHVSSEAHRKFAALTEAGSSSGRSLESSSTKVQRKGPAQCSSERSNDRPIR